MHAASQQSLFTVNYLLWLCSSLLHTRTTVYDTYKQTLESKAATSMQQMINNQLAMA